MRELLIAGVLLASLCACNKPTPVPQAALPVSGSPDASVRATPAAEVTSLPSEMMGLWYSADETNCVPDNALHVQATSWGHFESSCELSAIRSDKGGIEALAKCAEDGLELKPVKSRLSFSGSNLVIDRQKFQRDCSQAAPKSIPRLIGSIDMTNGEAFANAVSDSTDDVLGIKVRVEPEEAEGYDVSGGDDGLIITAGGVEINIQSGYRWEHGGYIIDGFYLVKSGGTHQGITSFGLEPVNESNLRANPSTKIIDKSF